MSRGNFGITEFLSINYQYYFRLCQLYILSINYTCVKYSLFRRRIIYSRHISGSANILYREIIFMKKKKKRKRTLEKRRGDINFITGRGARATSMCYSSITRASRALKRVRIKVSRMSVGNKTLIIGIKQTLHRRLCSEPGVFIHGL